uniref:DNA repair endonuclease XPF n=1 Tax=Phallusia mammillata TaxID=59560 RepID=A0A6F9DC95_9ASCI|nr:DNA repair endonuclease XPF [Phallusia mammillata]
MITNISQFYAIAGPNIHNLLSASSMGSEKSASPMESMLEYENQLFLDAFHENCLVVLCEGLGLERLCVNFLRLYCDLKELVFVLNSDQMQQEYYIEKLRDFNISQLPQVITSEFGAQERKKMYSKGGVFFASSRILVMDLLVDRIPVHLVSGIIVLKAHKMADTSMEPFIMRLFRQKNKEGFIKAFTDSPVALTGDYSKLEKVMKNLFVGKVFLWPRFHSSVIACLEKHKPEAIEISVDLTPSMRKIQTSLLEIVAACLKELKANNPGLDTDDFTVENSLGRYFDRSVRNQLDPIWNQLGSKTKHLVSDLRMLRQLLQALSQYDCVTFLNMLESSSGTQKAFGQNPGWIFLDAADSLFMQARYRVHGKRSEEKSKPAKSAGVEKQLNLEISPKWNVLLEILDEIREANKLSAGTELGEGKVMICASDMRGCYILRDFLQDGDRTTMIKIYNRTFKKNIILPVSVKKDSAPTNVNTLTQMFSAESKQPKSNDDIKTSTKSSCDVNDNKDLSTAPVAKVDGCQMAGSSDDQSMIEKMKVLESPETYLHALHGNPDPYSLTRSLEKIEPRFVILYDSSVHFVRQLEVHKACRPGIPLRVYFLTYRSSAEEQVYLTSLRREKEAFHSLIREKSTMVVPKEREGKNEDDPQFERNSEPANQVKVDTRKAGGQSSSQTGGTQQTVIVDMREFRSELPSLIHKRGMEIEPITLEVGDYILTPEICVERKSISDLIGSLNTGRLYTQCVAMTRHYKKPMLLIEFDANKAFSFQARGMAGGAKLTLKELNQKLTLLLLHFPNLRLAWCSSPSAAAQLFHEIKASRKQPEAVVAAAIGTQDGDGESNNDEKYNSAPYDFLLRLPGINAKNCRRILHHVTDLRELSRLSIEQLTHLLDSRVNAQSLHDFLHKKFDSSAAESAQKPIVKGKFKSKRPFGGAGGTKKAFGKRDKR